MRKMNLSSGDDWVYWSSLSSDRTGAIQQKLLMNVEFHARLTDASLVARQGY